MFYGVVVFMEVERLGVVSDQSRFGNTACGTEDDFATDPISSFRDCGIAIRGSRGNEDTDGPIYKTKFKQSRTPMVDIGGCAHSGRCPVSYNRSISADRTSVRMRGHNSAGAKRNSPRIRRSESCMMGFLRIVSILPPPRKRSIKSGRTTELR